MDGSNIMTNINYVQAATSFSLNETQETSELCGAEGEGATLLHLRIKVDSTW